MKCVDDVILKIRETLSSSNKIFMFCDGDCDGLCSYFQLKNVYLNIDDVKILPKEFEIQDELAEKVDDKYDLVVIFDVPVLSEKFLETLMKVKNRKIIWVDHHPSNSQELIDKFEILHLNPLNFSSGDNRPSCYWAYCIAPILENLSWLAVGSVADFFILPELIDFYKYDKNMFNLVFDISDVKRENLFDVIIKNPNLSIMKSGRDFNKYWVQYLTYEGHLIDIKNLFDMLFKMIDEDVGDDMKKAITYLWKLGIFGIRLGINSEKGFLFEKYTKIKNDYNVLKKKAMDISSNDLIFFEYENDMSFTRQLAEELSFRKRDFKVICICFRKNDPEKEFISGSFRGNGVAVNELLKEIMFGLKGFGGGHEFSAGFRVHKSDYPIFKKRLFEKFISN